MRIVYKIHITNLFAVILITLIGFYAYRNLDLVSTKLRFMEIADDLNASFLNTRLDEKNFFLYHDKTALLDLRERLTKSLQVMDSVKADIIRATGEGNFEQLKSSVADYLKLAEKMEAFPSAGPALQNRVREAGRQLRGFSSQITHLEKQKTNQIIAGSRNELFTALFIMLLAAITVGYLFFFNISSSLKKIKKAARLISDGNYHGVEEVGIPRDEVGSVLRAINYMSQELQKREEQILQSKKLASIGILTAGVAHELGNPLNNISVIAQTYQEHYNTLSETDRLGFMKMIDEESDRIKDIVKNLLDFSKPKKQVLEETPIDEVIHKSLKLVQNMLDISNIDIQLDLKEEIPPLMIDENQIIEVIVNLITNSIHATPPGGKLTVETRWREGADTMEILVTDTGKGIPAEILPHLFDPFFSTKGTSGTGLGLFVSYGIIKNHGGAISVSSEVGAGTTFTITLPVYADTGGEEGEESYSTFLAGK